MICGVFFDSFLTTQAFLLYPFRRIFQGAAPFFFAPGTGFFAACGLLGKALSAIGIKRFPCCGRFVQNRTKFIQKRLYFARDTCYSKNMNLPYARGLESYQGGKCHDDRYGCAREDPAVVPGARHYVNKLAVLSGVTQSTLNNIVAAATTAQRCPPFKRCATG